MAKKILGLVASYRKTGNSEIAVKEVAAKTGYDLELIRMPKLSILPCKGCYACLLPGKKCAIADDVEWLKEKILASDACIIGAPNYVLGPVGIMKMLADRALQFYDSLEALAKIPAVMALTLGREDFRGYADAALLSQAGSIGLNTRGIELFHGTHPAEVVMNDDFDRKTTLLADTLLSTGDSKTWGEDRCSTCGSDLFRVRSSQIYCALCESRADFSKGTFTITDKSNKLEAEGQHEHLIWLTEKKLEFAEKRETLKKIQERYQGGTWITPG